MRKKEHLGAIILAAGKGKRMNASTVNKVAMPLAEKPMIVHTVDLIDSLGIEDIEVVVGFAKESIEKLLLGRVNFVEQTEQLGTAHAVSVALEDSHLKDVRDVIILNGDDSAFYSKEIIENLISKHSSTTSALTFLTIERNDPSGLGRVVRDEDSNVLAVVEEKDATPQQKQIKEINPGCYIFSIDFLRKYISEVQKSPVTGEYYLTSLIDIGIKNNQKIETLKGGNLKWRGVNTQEELTQAEELYLKSS